MKKYLIFFLSILFLGGAIEGKAAMQPSSLVQHSVVRLEVYEDATRRDPLQHGSGVVINYEGCVLTTAHTLYDKTIEQNVYDHLVVLYTDNVRGLPQDRNVMEAKYVDKGRDIAILCPQKTRGIFYAPLELAEESNYENLSLGDPIALSGYPLIGGKTPVFSQGEVIGFWDQPDLRDFLKLEYFDDSEMFLIKTNAPTGPGGSGGAAFSLDEKVLGLVFAASLSPGGVNFLLSSKTIHASLREYRQKELKKAHLWKTCVKVDEGLYQKAGKDYYDFLCTLERDLNLERSISESFVNACKDSNLVRRDLYKAAVFIESGKSNLQKWESFSKNYCEFLSKKEERSKKVFVRDSLDKGDFAYKKERVSDLIIENKLAKELKIALEELAGKGKIPISAKNWNTLVNAYVYGGYDINSIYKGFKFGGFTVHPEIPFDVWQKSADYQKYINL